MPMTARLAAALDKLRHLRGPRVFYRQDDTPTTVTRRILGRWVRQAERRAGLPVTGRLHVLRHTFCSHLAMRGVPVKVIQELAGHADLQTTLRYMHLAQGSLETGIRALDNRTQVERHEAGSGGGTAH